MASRRENLKLVTRTALLLAVTLLFQELRRIMPGSGTLVSTLIIGSLVNLGLLVAAGIVGWRGSVPISVATPVVAFLQGHLAIAALIPLVAAGNILLVLVFEWICRKSNCGRAGGWIALGSAAALKTLFLWAAIARIYARLILPGLEGYPPAQAEKIGQALSLNFSWPQLVTAIVGGLIALIVIPAVRRGLREPAGPTGGAAGQDR